MNVKLEMEHEDAVSVLGARIAQARAMILAAQNGYCDETESYLIGQDQLYELLWGVAASLDQAQKALNEMVRAPLQATGKMAA